MSDDMPAAKKKSEPKVALYTVRPGDVLDVGWWGRATATSPAFVPESEVAGLCAEGLLAPLEYDKSEPLPVAEKAVEDVVEVPRKRKKE